MSNDAPFASFADADFGISVSVRSMMFGTIITTRMRGGGG